MGSFSGILYIEVNLSLKSYRSQHLFKSLSVIISDWHINLLGPTMSPLSGMYFHCLHKWSEETNGDTHRWSRD